jgi:hypothetical protein
MDGLLDDGGPALEPSAVAKLRAFLAAVDCKEPAVQAPSGLAAVSWHNDTGNIVTY